MENDNLETAGTVELVSTRTTGYLNADGQFVYGEPPAEQTKELPTYIQDGEDVVGE
jgi:hypothetical protein